MARPDVHRAGIGARTIKRRNFLRDLVVGTGTATIIAGGYAVLLRNSEEPLTLPFGRGLNVKDGKFFLTNTPDKVELATKPEAGTALHRPKPDIHTPPSPNPVVEDRMFAERVFGSPYPTKEVIEINGKKINLGNIRIDGFDYPGGEWLLRVAQNTGLPLLNSATGEHMYILASDVEIVQKIPQVIFKETVSSHS